MVFGALARRSINLLRRVFSVMYHLDRGAKIVGHLFGFPLGLLGLK